MAAWLADLGFSAPVVEWRGPSPFFFAAVPGEHVGEIHYAASIASYGWGCVPVEASANGIAFTTSLFPREGGYLVPLKAAVRKAAAIDVGEEVALRLRIAGPS
jgi:hypothetical protein